MTAALAIAIPLISAVVFALGVNAGHQLSLKRRQKVYANGYDQGRFDAHMDYITGYDAAEARAEAYGDGEVTL